MKIYYDRIEDKGLDLEASFSFKEGEDEFEIRFSQGRIERSGEAYLLSGVLEAKFRCPCDRCLDPVDMEFREEVSELLSPLGQYPEPLGESEEGLTDEEAGMYVTAKDHFDLEEFLREEALFLPPIKRLCREDCRGICPKCGGSLNAESCGCADSEEERRWLLGRELASPGKENRPRMGAGFRKTKKVSNKSRKNDQEN